MKFLKKIIYVYPLCFFEVNSRPFDILVGSNHAIVLMKFGTDHLFLFCSKKCLKKIKSYFFKFKKLEGVFKSFKPFC